MPGGDGTGPMGQGPMTGRAAGFCAGYPAPGYSNAFGGRGMGGFGRRAAGGRGWRNWFRFTGLTGWQRAAGAPPVPNAGQELEALKGQAQHLSEAMDEIRRRIQDLEANGSKD
ncbi:MAG: DUF5320 domain-containing protein [Planctomycetes bacterium]|nr:DUF5320 domain-containing protein [Planctomycetota bacterium]